MTSSSHNIYNENDKKNAEWLRELIRRGLIAPGEVDSRSILDIHPEVLRGFRQVHLFAGIGGWSYALRLAGIPDDFPVWTGSCPCQPFSAAGKRLRESDERHLWPAFRAAIAVCRPPIIFGEQVSGKAGITWLTGIRADLEELGYMVGAADLPACCVGAPHKRQRLFWVANAKREGLQGIARSGMCGKGREAIEFTRDSGSMAYAKRGTAERQRFDMGGETGGDEGEARKRKRIRHDSRTSGTDGSMAYADRIACDGTGHGASIDCGQWSESPSIRGVETLPMAYSGEHGLQGCESTGAAEGTDRGCSGGVGNAKSKQLDGGPRQTERKILEKWDQSRGSGETSPWSEFDIVRCSDGKTRRIEPGSPPLAHGLPARVLRLRGYGNAIVPQLAAEFVRAAMEAIE